MMYNGNEFLIAWQRCHELNFESEDIYFDQSQSSFLVFTNPEGSTWTLEKQGITYILCFNEEKVCVLDLALEKEIDAYIELILNTQEIEDQNKESLKILNDELWRNYGYGKN